jgi:hypothetical protein
LWVEVVGLVVAVSLLWLELGVLTYEDLTGLAEIELEVDVLYWEIEALPRVLDFGYEELVDRVEGLGFGGLFC